MARVGGCLFSYNFYQKGPVEILFLAKIFLFSVEKAGYSVTFGTPGLVMIEYLRRVKFHIIGRKAMLTRPTVFTRV